jgi:RND family efflux transporter MFP subunit
MIRSRTYPIVGLLLLLTLPGGVSGAEVRALLVPKVEATLSAAMAGRVVKLPLEEGDAVKEGELLAAFDCAIPKARLARARAELNGAERTLESNRKLSRLGSFSQLELALAESKRNEMRANLAEATALVEQCRLHAPFAGRVVKLHVHNHESVSQGAEMIELLDDSSLQLTLFVPSHWLRWLQRGQLFEVAIGETGKRYPAAVSGIAARVDAVSQSIEIQAQIQGQHDELLAGMSGEAHFSPPADE